MKCNNADAVYNTLKRCLKKNCHEYIHVYVHDLDFPLMREREGERERDAKLAYAHYFDAF